MSNILFATKDNKAQIDYLKSKKAIKKIYRWIYIKKGENEDRVVSSHFLSIIEYVFGSDVILSWPTGLLLKDYQKTYFIRWNTAKTVHIWWFTFVCNQKIRYGKYKKFYNNIQIPIMELAILENLYKLRKYQNKQISLNLMKQYIGENLKNINIKIIQKIIDNNVIFGNAGDRFFKIYGQLVGTKKAKKEDIYTTIIKDGHQIDNKRVSMLEWMYEIAKGFNFPKNNCFDFTNKSLNNHYCFWESYFSNYIEWTEMLVEEAEDIIKKWINANKPKDSYDVLDNYTFIKELYLVIQTNPRWFAINTADDFIKLVRSIHHKLTHNTLSDIQSWQFKTQWNKVGRYVFVLPKLVEWTLRYAYALSKWLDGMGKAVFLHYAMTEIHPFADGNGRTSRIVLNAFLIHFWLHPIIITSKNREPYLNALSRASQYSDYNKICIFLSEIQNKISTTNFTLPIKSCSLNNETQQDEGWFNIFDLFDKD